ncbi:MAG TPA: aldehyde ferredoxin oxidoreductase C-terminal domain-containing protein, partial [Thermoleophilia bacterium]|nr:aldehyde ferredoxin oxidoreductase C-terminal domain-containing protein [Thermoleophilia bacterium]
LARRYGHPEMGMEVKNLEVPGYDPRGAYGMGLSYATSDRGGCHMRAYSIGDEVISGRMAADTMERKPYMIIHGDVETGFLGQNFSSLKYSGIFCDFWAITPTQIARLCRHLFGREVSRDELMTIGERIWNLARLFNLREGVEADTLPRKLVDEPFTDGPSAGKAITAPVFEEAVREFYRLRGWDERGVPGEEKLRELEIDVRL